MNRKNIENWEERLEDKKKKRALKRKTKMKVSGASVKNLYKIMNNK